MNSSKALYEALKFNGIPYPDGKLCFCQMSVGNPLLTSHTNKCKASRAALVMYEESLLEKTPSDAIIMEKATPIRSKDGVIVSMPDILAGITGRLIFIPN